jgi:hypothetical protein
MDHLNRDDIVDSFTTFCFISFSPIRATFPTKYSYKTNLKMEGGGLTCGWKHVVLSNVARRDEATNTKRTKLSEIKDPSHRRSEVSISVVGWSVAKCCRVVVFFWVFNFFYPCVYGCMFCIILFNSVSYVFLLLCLCILTLFCTFCTLFCIFWFHRANWHSPAALTGFSVLFPQL